MECVWGIRDFEESILILLDCILIVWILQFDMPVGAAAIIVTRFANLDRQNAACNTSAQVFLAVDFKPDKK